MKTSKLFLFLLILFGLLSGLCNGQTIVKDSSGTLVSVKSSFADSSRLTGEHFKTGGVLYPVYAGERSGTRYILRASKNTNRVYRQYLTLQK